MVDRIADELARDDLKTQTEAAVRSAVNNYAGETWWFNQNGSVAVTLTSSIEVYALPTDFEKAINYTLYLPGPIRLDITQRNYDDVNFWQTGTAFGQPTDYAIFDQSLLLFPCPDQSMSTVLVYATTVSTLTDTVCTNTFMTYGEELIRSRARSDIQLNFLRDEAVTAEYLTLLQAGLPFYSHRERTAYQALRGRTTRRLATGHARGSNW